MSIQQDESKSGLDISSRSEASRLPKHTDTPRTDALLSGVDSFGNIPTMEDRYQRMCRHARTLERDLFMQTAVSDCLGRAVADKDADRIYFRDRSNELLAVLKYYKDECSGAEPSISVFNRMVDEAIAKEPQ